MKKPKPLDKFLTNAVVKLLKKAKGDEAQKKLAKTLVKIMLDCTKGAGARKKLFAKLCQLYEDICEATPPGGLMGCCHIRVRGQQSYCKNMTKASCEAAMGTWEPFPCPPEDVRLGIPIL